MNMIYEFDYQITLNFINESVPSARQYAPPSDHN